MPDENEQPVHLPHYQSTTAIHVGTRDQQKPMVKLLGRMVNQLKRPGKVSKPGHGPKKGLQARQTVPIKHKKIFY